MASTGGPSKVRVPSALKRVKLAVTGAGVEVAGDDEGVEPGVAEVEREAEGVAVGEGAGVGTSAKSRSFPPKATDDPGLIDPICVAASCGIGGDSGAIGVGVGAVPNGITTFAAADWPLAP